MLGYKYVQMSCMCSDLKGNLHLSHPNPFRKGEVLIKLLRPFLYIYEQSKKSEQT